MMDATNADVNDFEDDDELLVAYLDGELEREQRREVEERLISDEPFRERMQSLQRGWDMLEWLPDPVLSERSVQTTLELVVRDLTGVSAPSRTAVAASQTNKMAADSASQLAETNDSLPSAATQPDFEADPQKALQAMEATRRRRWWTRAVAAMLLIGAGFFAAGLMVSSRRIANDVTDLPVAIDMEAYSAASDLEFVRDLASSNQWRSVADAVTNSSVVTEVEALVSLQGPDSVYQINPQSNIVLRDEVDADVVLKRLTKLPPEHRQMVSSRWDRFDHLEPEEQEKLRSKARLISSQPDAEELLSVMRAYARWREQLSGEVVSEIETKTGAERQAAIAEGVKESLASIGRSSGRELSEEAIERIDFSLTQIVQARVDSGDSRVAKMLEFVKSRAGDRSDTAFPLRAVAAAIVGGESRGRSGRSFFNRPGGPPFQQLEPLKLNELETLEVMLPDKEYDELQTRFTDGWMRSMVLRDWAEESVRRKMRGESHRKSLLERYQELSPRFRETVDLLPPDQARQRLTESRR